jgi:iron complex outermembrane receptor protein
MDLRTDADSRDTVSATNIEGKNPRNQLSLRSRMDFPLHWELDSWYRYVDALRNPAIPSYSTMDARIGWNPMQSIELSLVGQNLLEPSHPEFATGIRNTTALSEVKRSFFGKVVWRW